MSIFNKDWLEDVEFLYVVFHALCGKELNILA